MKSEKYQKRFYRDWIKTEGLYQSRVAVQETDLHMLTDKPVDTHFVEERVRAYRGQIESYIQKDKRFLTTLKPLAVELRAPLIVRAMALAAKKANVGPMAAVAGAIAQFVGKDLLKKGCHTVVVENGGDIFLKIHKPLLMAVYAGTSQLSRKLKVRLPAARSSFGVCTSSGTVGHSLSFGCADAMVIFAKNAVLADAVATAAANRVSNEHDLTGAIAFARSIKGVSAVIVVLENKLATWGDIVFV